MSTTMLKQHSSPSKEPDPRAVEPIRDLLSPPREQWRHRQQSSDPDAASDDGSDIMNGSVLSTMTDRFVKALAINFFSRFRTLRVPREKS